MYTELKRKVYEANMELYRRGLVVYTWGNVSEADRKLGVAAIKPSGVPYETMTPDDIVVMSLETGERVEGNLRPSSDWPTHFEIYRAFAGVNGVTHTHSSYATAWAQAAKSIPCFGTTHADYFAEDVPCTRYINKEEAEGDYEADTGVLIAKTFENRNPVHTPGVLVAGHGPFTWGKDGAQSVYHAVVLEEVAKIATFTCQINAQAQPLPHHILHKHFSRKHGPNAYYGQK